MAEERVVPLHGGRRRGARQAADAEAPSVATEELRAEVDELRQTVTGLDTRARTRTRIALAQGVLIERYRLPDTDAAFALMRQASQGANIKMHQLASAVARVPGPDAGSAAWFPGRVRRDPPSLKALGMAEDHPNQGAVLTAALKQILTVAGAGMGDVQLAEEDGLRMHRHVGLSDQFAQYFAFVEQGTACARAAEAGVQVTVSDVSTAEVLDDEARQVILRAGSRACHSVPLVDQEGTARGVVSSHHPLPLMGFTRAQLQALDGISRTAGTWLSWHEETVILDALEDLHRQARTTAR
ncbi:ANTAR domain-containing protein [Streptomyces sp. NPDC048436]|uniref:ANTAR domain-containing protein n=1 Tax=Streptomyces sp. NPDC048436 TaxID=3365550 RepID=UPI00371FE324